jgi:RimJ/RimL family protein N-acetyltransferase
MMPEEVDLLTGQKVTLREKRMTDAADDYAWRCDADLARLDAVAPLRMSFREYSYYYNDEIQYGGARRRRFAIDTLEGKHIGNCMYYDIDDATRQAELGIMIGNREYWGQGYGTDAVTTLVRHVFEETILERIFLHTLDWNHRAQRCFEKCGFVTCGQVNRRGSDFLVMELRRDWVRKAEEDAAALPGTVDGKA